MSKSSELEKLISKYGHAMKMIGYADAAMTNPYPPKEACNDWGYYSVQADITLKEIKELISKDLDNG